MFAVSYGVKRQTSDTILPDMPSSKMQSH